jgi:hypothetical protein
MAPCPAWQYVRILPEANPEDWLGVPVAELPQVRNRYTLGFRIERLAISPRHSATEVCIPCKKGEISPVDVGWWAWSGRPGNLYRRLVEAAGPEATGPFGNGLSASVKRSDEAQVWFPDNRFDLVAEVMGARRRNSNWKGGCDDPTTGP